MRRVTKAAMPVSTGWTIGCVHPGTSRASDSTSTPKIRKYRPSCRRNSCASRSHPGTLLSAHGWQSISAQARISVSQLSTASIGWQPSSRASVDAISASPKLPADGWGGLPAASVSPPAVTSGTAAITVRVSMLTVCGSCISLLICPSVSQWKSSCSGTSSRVSTMMFRFRLRRKKSPCSDWS